MLKKGYLPTRAYAIRTTGLRVIGFNCNRMHNAFIIPTEFRKLHHAGEIYAGESSRIYIYIKPVL